MRNASSYDLIRAKCLRVVRIFGEGEPIEPLEHFELGFLLFAKDAGGRPAVRERIGRVDRERNAVVLRPEIVGAVACHGRRSNRPMECPSRRTAADFR